MAIDPVKLNNPNTQINPSLEPKKEHKPYIEAEGTITTDGLVHPLPPKGHLVNDNLWTGIKYFFGDIGYDMKSVRDGFKGTANDHQLGRLNDVGLRVGGIGIAAYLASRTSNPKARWMEYIGLATFLTAMSIYPKIAINGPAKFVHGYDIDKEYIDDQGRKKSVQQDSNYVPYDMYQGQKKDEDLDAIGDKMGIPRDIVNRHDVIREQMRKIATQNNTLWMLTAGFATPLMTALACCGLENYVVAPTIAKNRNNSTNKQINAAYDALKEFNLNVNELKDNNLSKTVENIVKQYRGQEFPMEEFDNIVKMTTEELPYDTAKTVKWELYKLLNPRQATDTETLLKKIARNKETQPLGIAPKGTAKFQSIVIPTADEYTAIVEAASSPETFRSAMKENIDRKIANAVTDYKTILGDSPKSEQILSNYKSLLESNRDRVLTPLTDEFKGRKPITLSEEAMSKLRKFTQIIGDFKENKYVLDKCEHFKFEYDAETVIARASEKFEKTFLKELGFTYSDLKKMRTSSEFTKEILDQKLMEVAHDSEKFQKVMTSLAKVMEEMDVALNGANPEEEYVKKLMNSYEMLFNGTAKRLHELGGFEETVQRLIKDDPETVQVAINNITEFLDGTAYRDVKDAPNKIIELQKKLGSEIPEEEKYAIKDEINRLKASIEDAIKKERKGLGSDKHRVEARIFERYQGSTNNFNRVMHTLEAYRRLFVNEDLMAALESKDPEYIKAVLEKCKETLLTGTASDHFQKLHTVNAPEMYRDIMKVLYPTSDTVTGRVSKETSGALEDVNKSLLSRFKKYIAKFKNIVANDTTDFTKPKHIFDKAEYIGDVLIPSVQSGYTPMARNEKAMSSLIAQDPVRFVREAADRKFGTQKWLRIVGGITAAVFSVTMLAQLKFGKLEHPENLKKQVTNETN